MMVNQLLNTGALGGIQVGDARENRFRYRMRAGQQQNGGPSTAGIPGAAMGPRHRFAHIARTPARTNALHAQQSSSFLILLSAPARSSHACTEMGSDVSVL